MNFQRFLIVLVQFTYESTFEYLFSTLNIDISYYFNL